MPQALSEDPRLARLTKLCLAFPEVTRELGRQHATFRVRRKVFAYFLDNHHGDGVVAFCWKAAPGENKEWVAFDPVRFHLPAYIGPRGWVALRLDVGRLDWAEIGEFARDSYRRIAPKELVSHLPTVRQSRGTG